MQEKAIRQYRILVSWGEEGFRQCPTLVDWKMDISSGKSWRTKEKVQYCLNPNHPHQFLYFRAIQGHSGSTINPALQDNVLLPEGFTAYIYHVGNGKELRSIVNHGLIPGGISLRTGRQVVFFTVVNLMDNQDGFGKAYATCHKQESRQTKILGNAFRIQYFGAIWSSLNKEDCNFIKQGQTQLSSMTHCLQSSLRKRYAWRPRISFIKGKTWF